MAIGKNKKLSKGKKGSKKKAVDPFLRKEWYDVKAPSMFKNRSCAKTLVTKTTGTKIASEQLKGRVASVNLADLNKDDDQGHKNIKLCIEEVQGKACLTDFHGMDFTRDKLCSLIRKWGSLLEAAIDVKTTDGYALRVFIIAFTKRQQNQVKTNCYAGSGQIRKIRARMNDIIQNECGKSALRDVVKKLIPASIEKEIEKKCESIFPLREVHIRKVKVLKKPKFDLTKLMELHEGSGADAGVTMVVDEAAEAKNTLTADAA